MTAMMTIFTSPEQMEAMNKLAGTGVLSKGEAWFFGVCFSMLAVLIIGKVLVNVYNYYRRK